MYNWNQGPSSSWANFSTFLDQVGQNQGKQPGQMLSWQERYELGRTTLSQDTGPREFEQQGPNNPNAPGFNPMQGFAQFGGPQQPGALQQQVLDRFRNPAQQIFNEIGQGSRYSYRREQQRDRGFNQFKEYGTQKYFR